MCRCKGRCISVGRWIFWLEAHNRIRGAGTEADITWTSKTDFLPRKHCHSVHALVRTSSSFSSRNLECMLYRPREQFLSSRLMQNNRSSRPRSRLLPVHLGGEPAGYGERKEQPLTSRRLYPSKDSLGVNSLYQCAVQDCELTPT